MTFKYKELGRGGFGRVVAGVIRTPRYDNNSSETIEERREWKQAEKYFANNPGQVKLRRGKPINFGGSPVERSYLMLDTGKIVRINNKNSGVSNIIGLKNVAIKIQQSNEPIPKLIETEIKLAKRSLLSIGACSRTKKSTKLKKGKVTHYKHYICMPFLGSSLRDRLDAGEYRTMLERLKIARKVILEIERLHGLNIVHFDIKPENIMISDDGTVRLIDLGSAIGLPPPGKRVMQSDYGIPRINNRGTRMYTPYLDPWAEYQDLNWEDMKRRDYFSLLITLIVDLRLNVISWSLIGGAPQLYDNGYSHRERLDQANHHYEREKIWGLSEENIKKAIENKLLEQLLGDLDQKSQTPCSSAWWSACLCPWQPIHSDALQTAQRIPDLFLSRRLEAAQLKQALQLASSLMQFIDGKKLPKYVQDMLTQLCSRWLSQGKSCEDINTILESLDTDQWQAVHRIPDLFSSGELTTAQLQQAVQIAPLLTKYIDNNKSCECESVQDALKKLCSRWLSQWKSCKDINDIIKLVAPLLVDIFTNGTTEQHRRGLEQSFQKLLYLDAATTEEGVAPKIDRAVLAGLHEALTDYRCHVNNHRNYLRGELADKMVKPGLKTQCMDNLLAKLRTKLSHLEFNSMPEAGNGGQDSGVDLKATASLSAIRGHKPGNTCSGNLLLRLGFFRYGVQQPVGSAVKKHTVAISGSTYAANA